jgi:hypothetical protein
MRTNPVSLDVTYGEKVCFPAAIAATALNAANKKIAVILNGTGDLINQ